MTQPPTPPGANPDPTMPPPPEPLPPPEPPRPPEPMPPVPPTPSWSTGPSHPGPPADEPSPTPPVPSTTGHPGAAVAGAAAGAAAGSNLPPPPPPPPAPPGPPLNPPGKGGSVYGKGANRLNLLGYLALAFGILGTGCCCCNWIPGLRWFDGAPVLGGIPAIILGIMHVMRVRKGQASQAWLGYVGIGLGILALILGICSFGSWDDSIQDDMERQFDDM